MKHVNSLTETPLNSSGFTLLELTISTAVSIIATGLVLQVLVNTQKGFTQDTRKIDQAQKNSAILDMIGKDIRQAGEQVEDARFPTIKITPIAGKGSSLIVYRGVAPALTLCNTAPVNLGVNVNQLEVSSNNAAVTTLNPTCVPDRTDTNLATGLPFNYPRSLQKWNEKRVAVDPVNVGIIYDRKGAVQQFNYTNESKTPDGASPDLLRINTTAFPLASFNLEAGMPVYLMEKKEYLVCTTTLVVRLNSLAEGQCPVVGTPDPSFQTVAINIDKINFQLSMRNLVNPLDPNSTENPNPIEVASNNNFPVINDPPVATDLYWHNIRAIRVKVESVAPHYVGAGATDANNADKAALTVEGSFYPRNIMSSRPFADVSN